MASCTHNMMRAAVVVVVAAVGMVVAVAAAPANLQVEAKYKCSTQDRNSCHIITGSSQGGMAEVMMLGGWDGCATEDEGWCILYCQADSDKTCHLETAIRGSRTSISALSGNWEEVTSPVTALHVASAALALPFSPRKAAALKAFIASLQRTSSA